MTVTTPESLVLDVHIPSSGPLDYSQCVQSYKSAEIFYKDKFKGKVTPFACYSWLLFNKHKEILKPDSNIIKFMDDYDIFQSKDNTTEDLWRIFNVKYDGDIDSLPQQTSLQRAYYKLLKGGEMPSVGHGVMLFREGKVLK